MKLNIGPLQNIPTKISFNYEIINIILPCLEGFVKHLFKEKLRLCRGGQARQASKSYRADWADGQLQSYAIYIGS